MSSDPGPRWWIGIKVIRHPHNRMPRIICRALLPRTDVHFDPLDETSLVDKSERDHSIKVVKAGCVVVVNVVVRWGQILISIVWMVWGI